MGRPVPEDTVPPELEAAAAEAENGTQASAPLETASPEEQMAHLTSVEESLLGALRGMVGLKELNWYTNRESFSLSKLDAKRAA